MKKMIRKIYYNVTPPLTFVDPTKPEPGNPECYRLGEENPVSKWDHRKLVDPDSIYGLDGRVAEIEVRHANSICLKIVFFRFFGR